MVSATDIDRDAAADSVVSGGFSRIVGELARSWTRGRPMERVAYLLGAVLFLSGLTHVVVLLVTGGTWSGPVSLRKPATFGLSFGLTLATATWVISFAALRRWLRTLLLTAFALTSALETTLITVQAWRGVPSHFNFETGTDSVISTTLAVGGAVIVLTVIGFAVGAMAGVRRLAPSMRLAVVYGLLVLVASMGVGAAMIASGVSQVRAGNPEVAYETAGSLKPIHAVAMHAVLILPALAWLLGFTGWREALRVRLVVSAMIAYTVLAGVIAAESVVGVSPLEGPAAATAVSVGALVVLVAIGVVAVNGALRGRQRSHSGPHASR